MNNTAKPQVLVLGATGKTGSRVAARLSALGASVRTAARSGADVHFDWDSPATFAGALRGATGVYLVSPTLRVDFAGAVARFLDHAERAGVRNVTYLSAYGTEHAPPKVALRAVELDLAARSSLLSSVIRPAWFMEDFSETFLQPVNDEIVVPAGDGAEAFVSVEDIASVATATLTEPDRHAGRAYAPTGPQALTMAEAAQIISAAAGRTIAYRDTDREEWIAAMVTSGIPAEYAQVLRPLTATVASGNGARPNGDVRAVTGTAPITFAEFAATTAPAWKLQRTRTAAMKKPITNPADFAALDPFFRIIEQGLDGLAGPGHFFDLLAEDAVFEYVITVPGYPRRVEGRAAVAELYRPYGAAIVLDRCFDLAVHHDPAQGTVVLEYASEGRVVATGAPYANRYISVLTLRNREVVHWRDYLDPVAVFDALGWPSRVSVSGGRARW